jgi:hypothetical protein
VGVRSRWNLLAGVCVLMMSAVVWAGRRPALKPPSETHVGGAT